MNGGQLWKSATIAMELVQSSSSSSARTTIPGSFTNVPRELGSGAHLLRFSVCKICTEEAGSDNTRVSNLVDKLNKKSKSLSPIPVAGPGRMPLSRLVCRIIVVSSANIARIEAVTVILLA